MNVNPKLRTTRARQTRRLAAPSSTQGSGRGQTGGRKHNAAIPGPSSSDIRSVAVSGLAPGTVLAARGLVVEYGVGRAPCGRYGE